MENVTLPPHQQRVVTESAELDEKLSKLGPFLETAIFGGLPADEQWRLIQQRDAMAVYADILHQRIAAF